MNYRSALYLPAALLLGACQDRSPVEPGADSAPGHSVQSSSAKPLPGQYIVVFKRDVQDVPGAARQLAGKHRGRLKHTYTAALKGMAVELSDAEAAALRQDPEVRYVEQDQLARAAGSGTQTGATAGLDRIDQRNLPLNGSYGYATDGSGAHVYILDTGINFGHNDFGGRATLGADFIGDGANGVDCTGHGTHVAGTVGGTVYGVAKKVALHAVRVLDCTETAPYSTVIAGVDWVTANHVSPAVANMSLSGPPSAALDEAIANSIAAGVTYVVAAGNGGSDACGVSPADAPDALTIAASSKTDAFASFSDVGACVDLTAPGVDITSDWIGSASATASENGTSMASPHVAGAAALYLGANPTATPAEVATALIDNATPDVLTGVPAGTPNKLLFTGFLGTPPPPASQWSGAAAMLTPRTALALGSTGTQLFAIGGLRNGTILATVERYTGSTNSWLSRARMPGARYDGDGASLINGVLYVPGGRNVNGVPTRTFYAYNVSTNIWSTKAPLPAASACGGSGVISGQLYVLTGCNATGYRGTLARYTPSTNVWTTRAGAPAPHGYPAVAAIGAKLYVAGGRNAAGAATTTLHVYTAATNSWATKAPMPAPRFGAAAQVINGKLYVIGGTTGTGDLATVLIYDPVANSWITGESMPTARRNAAVGIIGTQLYVAGGQTGATSLTTVERYTP
jgi:subtilisin family serine protease